MDVRYTVMICLTVAIVAIAGALVAFLFTKKRSFTTILWWLVLVFFLYEGLLSAVLYGLDRSDGYSTFFDGILLFLLWYYFLPPLFLLVVVWIALFDKVRKMFWNK